MDMTTVVAWIKDLGLPIAALIYLFRCYQERITLGDQREQRYSEIIEAHSIACTGLTKSLENLTAKIEVETTIRQDLLNKLIDIVTRDSLDKKV